MHVNIHLIHIHLILTKVTLERDFGRRKWPFLMRKAETSCLINSDDLRGVTDAILINYTCETNLWKAMSLFTAKEMLVLGRIAVICARDR